MASRESARAALSRLVEAYNNKDRDALGDLYAEDISLWSSLGESRKGREEVLGHVAELFKTLPDERMRADTVVTDGSTIVVELTSTGTDAGGESYEIRFTEVFELSDGKFTAIRTYIDPDDVEAIAH